MSDRLSKSVSTAPRAQINVIDFQQLKRLGKLQIPLGAPIRVFDDLVGRTRNRAVFERIERLAVNLASVFLQVFPVGVVQAF